VDKELFEQKDKQLLQYLLDRDQHNHLEYLNNIHFLLEKKYLPKKSIDAGVRTGPRRQNVFSKQIKSRKFPCKSPTIKEKKELYQSTKLFCFFFLRI